MKISRLLVGLTSIASASFLFTQGACTTINDGTATQCRSQADCLARGPEFAETTCSLDRVCVKSEVSQAQGCNSNKECVDGNGGQPAMCRQPDRKCVPLLTPECTRLSAEPSDIVDPNAVVMGVVIPFGADGLLMEAGFNFARTEIRKTLRGLPPAVAGGPPRPLILLTCQVETGIGLGSQAQTVAAAEHLTKTLKVPVVMGSILPNLALAVANQFTIPTGTLQFVAAGTPLVTTLGDNDLVFRTSFSYDLTTQILTPFINEYVEPRLQTDLIVPAGEEARLFVFQAGDGEGTPLGAILLDKLRFNGKSVAENQVAGNFKMVNYGDPGDRVNNSNPDSLRLKAVADALAYKPHIVLWATPPGASNQLMAPMNQQWAVATGNAPRPIQISLIAPWESFIVPAIKPEAARTRYFGIRGAPLGVTQAQYDSFVVALRSQFPDLLTQTIAPVAAQSYDAVYMAAYAAAAVGNEPLTGANMSKALRRVTNAGGEPIAGGTADLSRGVAALGSGKNISYTGPGGLYNYDKNGERSGTPEMFCVTAAGTPPIPNGTAASGYSWNVEKQKSEGTVNCP